MKVSLCLKREDSLLVECKQLFGIAIIREDSL